MLTPGNLEVSMSVSFLNQKSVSMSRRVDSFENKAVVIASF